MRARTTFHLLRPFVTDRSTSLLNPMVILVSTIVLVATLAIVWWSVTSATTEAPDAGPTFDPSVRAVRVAQARSENHAPSLRLPGVTRSRERGALAFLHGGQLVERRVRRGQTVEAGDILALLHNPALMPGADAAAARAREALLNLDQLERETERLHDLHQRNLVPTEELERITSRRDSAAEALARAEAELNEAREQLAEATLRAPYPATVAELYVEPGQVVSAGQPVLSLIGNNGLEIAVQISAEFADHLAVDAPVIITRRDQAQTTTGQIREISPAGPGQPSTVIVELPSGIAGWRAGQSVTVELDGAASPLLSVPLAAVINPGAGRAYLFRVENSRVISIPVTTGAIRNGQIAVDGALAAGDIVAIAGHSQLLDNEPVRVLP